MRRFAMSCLALTLLACGEDEPAPAPTPPPEPAKPAEPAEPAEPAPAPDQTLTPDEQGVVHLTGNDLMRYNANRIEVPAGKPVKIELEHVGKMSVEQMGHNVVILQPGTEPVQFAAKGVAAKATDYIADAVKDKVIAKSKLLGGGESDTVELELPGPGTYPFVCTFPGHAALMKGELVAK